MKKETPPNLPLSGEERREAPYPGLRPYHEDEQGKFFGRDVDAEILLDKVLTNRLTLLFAASGVGKSSLLQAAVIPRLKSPTGENLEVVYHIDWVSEPVSSVRAAVLQALHASGKLPEGAADEAGQTLAELLEFCGLFVRHPLVLILDQFEEFFRYQRATASFQPFIEQLTAVITNPQLPVSLVLSMREDFALELNAFKPRLPTILFENFYRLEKLAREGAREAIVTPVEQVGFRYEPVLLETLLDDLLSRELDRLPHSPVVELLETVEPPYLQIVCAQLWELNKTNPDKLLRLVTYEKAGKAKGILSNYLSGVLQTFTLTEKQLASKAFDHLASQRGVKMAYTAAALAETVRVNEAALDKVLEKLATVRILRSQQRGDATWYELYHDMFSGSIENWNGAWKDRMRRRRFAQVASAGFVSIAALFAGWDYYVNTSNYHLRLSPKQGISDQVELWQGKPGSFDLFHQQHYLVETDFQRHELEPDKQFSRKLVDNYNDLQSELIGNLPIEQRVFTYTENGDIQNSLKLAKNAITSKNIGLAERTLLQLVNIRVSDAARMIYDALQTPRKTFIMEGAYNNIVSASIGIILVHDKIEIKPTMPDIHKEFWVEQLAKQIANQTARKQLITLGRNGSMAINSEVNFVDALINSPDTAEIIPFLIGLLKDENDTIQLSTLQALGELQAKEAIPILLEILKNGNGMAIEVLGNLQAKDAIPVLLGLLMEKDKDLRSKAAKELGKLKVKDAIPLLVELLPSEDHRERSITKVLGAFQVKDIIPELMWLLKNSEGMNSDEVNSGLVAANKLGEFQAKSAIPELTKMLKNKNSHAISAAAIALGTLQATDTIPELIQLLKTKNDDVISAAATALGELQAIDAIPELIQLLKNKNDDVISAAVTALGELQATDAIPELMQLLKNKNDDIISAAATALGELKATDAIPDLMQLFKHEDWDTRNSAMGALEALQAKDAIPELIKLLKDEDSNVIFSASKVLGALQAKEAIPELVRSLSTDCSATLALGQLQNKQAIPELITLLKQDAYNCDALTVLGQLQAKEAIPELIKFIKNKDNRESNSQPATHALVQLGEHSIMPNLFATIGETLYWTSTLPNLESASRIASGELLDFILRRLKNGNPDTRQSAAIAATRMERGNNLNEVQKRLLRKALSLIDQRTRDAAAEQLADEDEQEVEAKANQLPINQPPMETKSLTLNELKIKLGEFNQRYADWRERRDADHATNSVIDPKTTDSETDKLADPAPFIYEYAYAIANMDEAEGIKLLGHNLAKVREAAARGLANSDFLGVPLLQNLEREWLATDNPITRQGLFHAIDIALLAMEGIGADKELEALKAYEPTLTNERSAASIKPRVEWTRIQLQWRVDALKELKELADRQLPGLLKEYCLNPDGTDMKPEECTIER